MIPNIKTNANNYMKTNANTISENENSSVKFSLNHRVRQTIYV